MVDRYLWPSTNGPVTDSSNAPISLGTEFDVTGPAWLIGFRVWRATTGDTGVTVAGFAVSGATLLGSTVSVPDGGTGWLTVALAPVPLAVGTRYVAVAHHPVRYPGTGGYWLVGQPGAGGQTQGVLHAPDDAGVTGAPLGQGRYEEGPSIVAPTQTFQGGCYWISPIITDVDPGGRSGTATLTATGSITSTGIKGGRGIATITGASALADAGRTGRAGTATILGTATAASTGVAQRRGTGTLTGIGTLAGTGISRRTGTSAVAATGALTSTGHNPDNVHATRYRAGEPAITWTCGPPLI